MLSALVAFHLKPLGWSIFPKCIIFLLFYERICLDPTFTSDFLCLDFELTEAIKLLRVKKPKSDHCWASSSPLFCRTNIVLHFAARHHLFHPSTASALSNKSLQRCLYYRH